MTSLMAVQSGAFLSALVTVSGYEFQGATHDEFHRAIH
jgi:hypothetical protein